MLTHKDGLLVLANGATHAQPFLRMIETPRDGSGTTQVSYEHSFSRRSSSGPESTP